MAAAWLSDSDSDVVTAQPGVMRSPIFSDDSEEDGNLSLSFSKAHTENIEDHQERSGAGHTHTSDDADLSAHGLRNDESPLPEAVDDEDIVEGDDEDDAFYPHQQQQQHKTATATANAASTPEQRQLSGKQDAPSTRRDQEPVEEVRLPFASKQASSIQAAARPAINRTTSRQADGRDDAARMKKRDIQRQLQQVALKIARTEQEIYTSSLLRDHVTLADARTADDASHAEDQILLATQLGRIRGSIAALQSALANTAHQQSATTPQFVDGLRRSMEQAEAVITQFKGQQREVYEQMMQTEKVLLKEVEAHEQRIEAWLAAEQSGTSAPKAAPRGTAQTTQLQMERNVPPEVLALEQYLIRHGGACGGWDEYDHGVFMRLRAKLGPDSARFVLAVQEALPSKSSDDVHAHAVWMAELLELQERKRLAIAAWKEGKDQAEAEKRAAIERERSAQDKQLLELAQVDAKKKADELQKRKDLVEEWRQRQAERQQQVDDQRKRAALHAQQAQERADEERRMKAREQLDIIKQQREREEAAKQEREQERERVENAKRKAALAQLPAFRERDEGKGG